MFEFLTKWEPPIENLLTLSVRHEGVTFLLAYSCWESGFRGQTVIMNGTVVEQIHRLGYDGPGFLFSDITHPVVDLFNQYLEPLTLAQHARDRLQDAVSIVAELQKILFDRKFTASRYRANGSPKRVKKTQAQLTKLLKHITEESTRISFEDVLVSAQSRQR